MLVPLLWLVSTSLKGPAEDIFTSPPSLFPSQPSLDAYGRLFRDNPLWTYIFNSSVVSFLAVVANLLFCSLGGIPTGADALFWSGLVLALVVATILIPFQVVMIPLYFADGSAWPAQHLDGAGDPSGGNCLWAVSLASKFSWCAR